MNNFTRKQTKQTKEGYWILNQYMYSKKTEKAKEQCLYFCSSFQSHSEAITTEHHFERNSLQKGADHATTLQVKQ